MTVINRNFPNLSAWVNYSETDRTTDNVPRFRSSCSPRADFTGVSTKAKAYELFHMGHPEGVARMKKVLEGVTSNVILPTMNDQFDADVTGCAPNVEAYVQGIPEDMFVISQIEQNAPPTQLTVQFELAYSAWITIEQATLGGAVVFAAMEALRSQGCAVSILMTHTVQSNTTGNIWQSSVMVPNNIDLDSLAFIFTHPAMLRVMVFSMMEHEPAHIREEFNFNNNGYSRPYNHKNTDVQAHIDMSAICNKLRYTTTDLTSAKAMIKSLVDSKFQSI